ncbi:UbiA family prenyltransferase [Dyadobacter tibetensis]|uniref:UbiA family prenyltransferase n=1 Tax=Dyadobacter tibetensis TaxID=1211851 RepID=UPI000470096D|nr:UbiA family prenyltransferase [Dyadobacter tibetensis]
MLARLIQFIFFANYFVGFLAIALSIETAYQLNLPFLPPTYYILLFCVTVLYYTFAYTGPISVPSDNPRTMWYQHHRRFVRHSQWVLLLLSVGLGTLLLLRYGQALLGLPWPYWLMISLLAMAAALYYGLLPKTMYHLNLRNTGWLKAFVIGFVWAGTVNLLPIIMAGIEEGAPISETGFMLWLFVKNWMFCTVNAIMFDIKDYEDDSNRQLKTFVVRFGLYPTITYILIPLLIVGLIALLLFAGYKHFAPLTIALNTLPFLCLLWVAFALHTPRKILFYLIVIDGLLLIKAICGILGIVLLQQ